MTVEKKSAVPTELLDFLLANYQKPEALIEENRLLMQWTKLLVERALGAEMIQQPGAWKVRDGGQSCRKHAKRQEKEDAQG